MQKRERQRYYWQSHKTKNLFCVLFGFWFANILYSNISNHRSRLKFLNGSMHWEMRQFPYHLWHRYGSRGQVCVAPGCRAIHGFRLPVGTSIRFLLKMSPLNFWPEKKGFLCQTVTDVLHIATIVDVVNKPKISLATYAKNLTFWLGVLQNVNLWQMQHVH